MSCARICAGPIEGCSFFSSRIAATSTGASPLSLLRADTGGGSAAAALRAFTFGAGGAAAARSAARLHRRSDSSVVPTIRATSPRRSPVATSRSASARCASVNRFPLGSCSFFFAFDFAMACVLRAGSRRPSEALAPSARSNDLTTFRPEKRQVVGRQDTYAPNLSRGGRSSVARNMGTLRDPDESSDPASLRPTARSSPSR